MSNYRCGEHIEQPVTWRGHGCPECVQDQARRREHRAAVLRARRIAREAREAARRTRR